MNMNSKSKGGVIENFRNAFSKLYGQNGELWTKNGRLLDYSYAGNRINMTVDAKPINIKTAFGAKGDGVTDDTLAFKKALQEANGILYIPQGTYIITGRLLRTNTNPLIIRGDGEGKTIIHFPKSMRELFGSPGDGNKWSFKPCFFEIDMQKKEDKLCDIIKKSPRGSHLVYCNTTQGIKQGDWVRIALKDDNNASLFKLVYQKEDMIPKEYIGTLQMRFPNKVLEIGDGYVKLARPLPIDVELDCHPEIQTLRGFTSVAAIENMSFTAAYKPYAGHLIEDGYNMVSFKNVVNGWVKNVSFHNADIALKLSAGCHFCNISNTTFTSDKNRSGHHGIWVAGCSDNLITDFKFKMKYEHDISVEGLALQNVFTSGEGVDLNFDHHRVGPYGNLFTDIHLGKGTRYHSSSGQSQRGAHSGKLTTFWGLTSDKCTKSTAKCEMLDLPPIEKKTLKLPNPRPWGVGLNFVGTFDNTLQPGNMLYIDSFENNNFVPFNLYNNMVLTQKTRLGNQEEVQSITYTV